MIFDLNPSLLHKFELHMREQVEKFRKADDWETMAQILDGVATTINEHCAAQDVMVIARYRHVCVKVWGWSIVDSKTIVFVAMLLIEARNGAGGVRVHDLGAGLATFAAALNMCLTSMGAEPKVVASDLQDMRWIGPYDEKNFKDVKNAHAKPAVMVWPADAFSMIFPEYDVDWPVDALREIARNATHQTRFVYWGESKGRFNANDAFFDELDARWRMVGEHYCPRWENHANDFVQVFAFVPEAEPEPESE